MAMVLGEFGTWRNSTIGNRLNGRFSDRLFRKTGLRSREQQCSSRLSLQTSEHNLSRVGDDRMVRGRAAVTPSEVVLTLYADRSQLQRILTDWFRQRRKIWTVA